MELPYKNLQITKKCRYSITINNPLTIPKYRVHLKKNKSENLEEWRTCFSSWYNFIVSDTWTTCLPVSCKGSLISKMLPTWKTEMSTDLITELCYSYMLPFFFFFYLSWSIVGHLNSLSVTYIPCPHWSPFFPSKRIYNSRVNFSPVLFLKR